MTNREKLHQDLLLIIPSKKVYYQPPENIKMEYPCIRYNRSEINTKSADNINYIKKTGYDITLIYKKISDDITDDILDKIPMSSYDRHYISNNLHHDVIKIYY